MADAKSDRVMPLMELAARWGWSRSKLFRLVERQEIPHLRIGPRRDIHFRERDVEAWLEQQTIGSQAAPRAAARTAAGAAAFDAQFRKDFGLDDGDNPFS